MSSILNQCRQVLLSTAVTTLSLGLAASGAIAANFTYQDSPNISLSFDNVSVNIEGNTRTVSDIQAINISDHTVLEAGLIIPFLMARLEDNFITLTWEDDQNGWLTEDYDGQGNSLFVTSGLPERLRLGNVADLSGESVLPLTQPCSNSPSCVPLPPVSPITQQASDEIPFISFGQLAPDESFTFDAAFSFHFEDDREGTLSILPTLYTVEAIPSEVPEPASLLGIVVISGAIALRQRKNKGSIV